MLCSCRRPVSCFSIISLGLLNYTLFLDTQQTLFQVRDYVVIGHKPSSHKCLTLSRRMSCELLIDYCRCDFCRGMYQILAFSLFPSDGESTHGACFFVVVLEPLTLLSFNGCLLCHVLLSQSLAFGFDVRSLSSSLTLPFRFQCWYTGDRVFKTTSPRF